VGGEQVQRAEFQGADHLQVLAAAERDVVVVPLVIQLDDGTGPELGAGGEDGGEEGIGLGAGAHPDAPHGGETGLALDDLGEIARAPSVRDLGPARPVLIAGDDLVPDAPGAEQGLDGGGGAALVILCELEEVVDEWQRGGAVRLGALGDELALVNQAGPVAAVDDGVVFRPESGELES